MDEANLNKEFLKATLEKDQDQLIDELCGKKYARNTDKKFQRAGTTQRTLVTRYGTINKVQSGQGEVAGEWNHTTTTLPTLLGIRAPKESC